MSKEYKSVKLEIAVYKKADYAQAINLKPDGKKRSLSDIVAMGLEALINKGVK